MSQNHSMNQLLTHEIASHKRSKNILLFICLLSASILFGQDLSYIYGKVIDSKTGEPLAFASVSQKNKPVGLITNDDGGFKIPKEYQEAKVTLIISFIGYYPKEVAVTELNKYDINIIKLVEKTESLNEVVVKATSKPLTAKQIVKNAIKNIKSNYPFQPFSYVGYYRDYQKDKIGTYLNMNEAILQVHDPGFGYVDYLDTKTTIFKYLKNDNFPENVAASQPYDYNNQTKTIDKASLGYLSENANEFILLRIHDAIRNYNINTYDYVNNLESDFIKNHKFTRIKETSSDDTPLYEIKISKDLSEFYAEGNIFISKDDYKIYKLQYSVYEKLKNKLEEDSGLIFNVIVEYANKDGIMYPKYISFNNLFKSVQPPEFLPIDAELGYTTLDNKTAPYIDIIFNHEIDPEKAGKKKNYKLAYKNKRIKIDRIQILEDVARIYLKNANTVFTQNAWLNKQRLSGEDFFLEVKNFNDIYGNTVLKGEVESYNQYREFFIQELNLNADKINSAPFMIKSRPISSNQPINTPDNISDYWMNTPLRE